MDIKNSIPLVSIIMPAYNAAPFIEEAINSVISQTVTDWELFVIDDCSKDETYQIAQRFAVNDSRITVLQNEVNSGVARTRNRGFDLVRGTYVALLDSDDYWRPHMLDKMIARAEETHADIIYCSYELVDEIGNKVCNDFIVPPETTFDRSLVRSVITCSTVLISLDFARKNRFPINMYHEDIALWFSALRDGAIARGIEEVLAAYRQRDDSRSAGKLKSAFRRWAIYRKHLKLPFFKSVFVMIKYAYYGILKFKRI